jgi:hypothetical protein
METFKAERRNSRIGSGSLLENRRLLNRRHLRTAEDEAFSRLGIEGHVAVIAGAGEAAAGENFARMNQRER